MYGVDGCDGCAQCAKLFIINPRRMRRRVTVLDLSVCLSYHTSCYIIHFQAEKGHHRLLYGVFNSRISPKRLCSGDMALLACLYDHGLPSLDR